MAAAGTEFEAVTEALEVHRGTCKMRPRSFRIA
jgi:hypothetical protein